MPFKFSASPTNEINPWKNKARLGDFWCHNYFVIWKTKDREQSWKHIFINFGIRRSDKIQWFPIWNRSNNSQKSILFGLWKLFIEIGYKY